MTFYLSAFSFAILPLHYLLGKKIQPTTSSLFLSQSQYASDLLSCVGMTNCKLITTPLILDHSIVDLGNSPAKNPDLYRSLIGSLQYVTTTRPNISFVVNLPSICIYHNNSIHFFWSDSFITSKAPSSMVFHFTRTPHINSSFWCQLGWISH